MSRGSGDQQLKQRAETLAAVLIAELHPQVASEKLGRTLSELPERATQEQVINHPLPRQNSRTAVHLAASKGLWQCLEVLLKNGGDPNSLSSHKDLRQTPLHLAAREGNGKCIEILLENGANYTIENARKQTALNLTSDQFCQTTIENTIARLEVPKRNKSEEDIMKKLHSFVENGENHLFFQLYTNQSTEKVDLGTRWFDRHIEPDSTETLLYRGCANEAEPIVEFILSRSVNKPLPNLKTGETPLHVASQRGNANIVSRLLQHSPKLLLEQSASGISALHIACRNGYRGVVELILEHVSKLVSGLKHVYNEDTPFSLDFRDSDDVTPFYLACLHGFSGIVRQFLAIRTNLGNSLSLTVNAAPKNGHTALHAATCSGNCEAVELLLPLEDINADCLAPPIMETKRILWLALGGSQLEDIGPRKLFVTVTGQFVTDTEGLMKSDRLLRLTPLAEACVHSHTDIIEAFLRHGVCDEDGLACRVLVAVGEFDLCQKVLAYHCKFSKNTLSKGSIDICPEDMWSLHLTWSGKKLPVVKKEWFGSNAHFHPAVHRDVFVDASDHRHSRVSLSASLSLHLPQRIDHSFIRNVTLKSNCLKSVPLQVFQLVNLSAIDLSDNQLVILPTDRVKENQGRCGWECQQLKHLNVSSNMLTEFPPSVWLLPEIKRINAARNKITKLIKTTVFSTLYLTRSLEKIDLSHNSLTEINALLFEIQSLGNVVLSHNQFTRLPLDLWAMESLHELNLSHNCLTTLAPPDPADADEEAVDVPKMPEREGSNPAMAGATRVTGAKAQFRQQMSRFPSLDAEKSIGPGGVLDANMYRLDVDGENDGDAVVDVSQLRKLDLSDNKFEEFPRELPCIVPALEVLNISNNPGLKAVDIQFLPPTLKRFHARDCQIERFGGVLNKEQLKLIKQSCVHKFLDVTCQHRNHTRLVNLTSLNLQHNCLSHFQVLYHMPPSTGIPDFGAEESTYQSSISASNILYPSLGNLNLSHNRLQGQFNPNVAHLATITSIQLNDNEPLEVIPYQFGHLKKLKGFSELKLSNLPELVQPPKDLQQQDKFQQLMTYLAAGLRESEMCRTIKVFLVGKAMRGKTTLLHKLSDKKIKRTADINIVEFSYTPVFFHKGKEPVQFLVWDFARQDQYHSTHHCFYSQRSLYLAVFRLSDEERGVKELDPWLRNIQLRAPGSPVVIVGTHMDKVKHRVADLEEMTRKCYMHKTSPYPNVVDVVSVSSTAKMHSNLKTLKKILYNVSTHLYLTQDRQTLKYDPTKEEDDAKALFRQQVPKSFLTLQNKCLAYVEHCQDLVEPTTEGAWQEGEGPGCHDGLMPVMNEEEFRGHFSGLFNNDKEELDEAVSFVHLRGTLLHFDDHNLRDFYFLNPQWLAKLMADVIHPQAIQGDSPVINGVVQVSHLFWNRHFSDCLKRKYIQLLEKFEIALKISHSQVLIPSLMPNEVVYPRPNDDLRGIKHFPDEFYVTVLRRFWLADFIPEGFWPRLICRVANDQQIEQILRTLIGEDDVNSRASVCLKELTEQQEKENMLKWKPWKMGVAFSHRGRTLLVVKEESNVALETNEEIEWLPAKKRIEIHVYVHEWFEVQSELQIKGCQATMLQNTFSLPGIATQLLVKISQHVLSLSKDWFQGMLESQFIYVPCWKCYGQMELDVEEGEHTGVPKSERHYFPVSGRGVNFPVYAFNHEKCIVIAAQQEDLQCPVHGPVKVIHTAPDLIFWDLCTLSAYKQDMSSPLVIKDGEVLGRGGYGFVCEGELILEEGKRKKVAVKGFLSDNADTQDCSVAELLEICKRQENLYHAYKEIRQEVSFLAQLDHPNLTKLCGVRTSPHMCLLLELAPHDSLCHTLKVYKKYEVVLGPVTLQASIHQIASGMEYLHMKQIVHKDMKSANVLVWHFPSGRLSREKRVEKAGNVWLKLADYGISQVFTEPIMKLSGACPEGTPGFMAPELFGMVGQEIATEKVDVFAFGMVVYELLSLQAPFTSVEHPKRNNLVKDRKRPHLQGKALRSPLIAQSIMRMCWAHEPDDRPTMNQVATWVRREEFSRLRAEILLEKVESVSCACVYHVALKDKEDDEPSALSNGHSTSGIGHIPVENSINTALYGGFSDSALMDDMAPCTEYTRLQHSMASFNVETSILPPVQSRHGTITSDGSVSDSIESETNHSERSKYAGNLGEQAYSQMWVCDRKEKGLLKIFTYFDSQAGYYAHACRSHDQINAICPVRNMMWIGTTRGILKLKHAPTLYTKFNGELKSEGRSLDETFVLAITHVEKASSVLVSTNAHEIWAFSDKLIKEGLVIEERIRLAEGTNCYQMIVVEVFGSLEVWGTMDNSQLIMLHTHGRGWMMDGPHKVDCKPEWQFFLIAHAAFQDKIGATHNHLWIPYRQKGLIVCWDLQKRKYKTKIDTAALKCCDDPDSLPVHPKVTAIATNGKKVLVGTDVGTVGVIDSETCEVLYCLQWHASKVRTLLVMPKEMEPCICPEFPLAEYQSQSVSGTQLFLRAPLRKIVHQRTLSESDLISLADVNPCLVDTLEQRESCIVASIGNGRRTVTDTNLSKKNDVTLLLWRC